MYKERGRAMDMEGMGMVTDMDMDMDMEKNERALDIIQKTNGMYRNLIDSPAYLDKDDRLVLSKSKLEGSVELSGAKNSVLRLLAASLLCSQRIELSNFPSKLSDVIIHLQMLEVLGKKVSVLSRDRVVIEDGNSINSVLNWTERSIRNTLLILGALVTRTGHGRVPLPGGCNLGDRKYDLHVMLLRKLGAEVWEEDGYLCASAKGRLKGSDIHLPIRSTGATENAIISAVLAEGKTTIWNPHIRPEIIDLVKFLTELGAKIKVFGQQSIEIDGVEGLNGGKYSVIPDNMEAITWMIAAVITNGDIEINDFPFEHLEIPIVHLRESGARFFRGENSLIVRGGKCYPIEIATGPYPAINSDMQPLFAVYGACAAGESRIIDLRFPGRYAYAEELKKQGVQYRTEGGMLIIDGGARLTGSTVSALDLRAGASLVLAGLHAEGQTIIEDAWQISRGYEDIVTKLKCLGGNIDVI